MDPLLYSQFQDHLINWCRGEELDINHAILIVGVPQECAIGQIEEAMNTVRCWGRVQVRGSSFNAKTQSLTVLCECKEKINPKLVPPEVIPEDGSERWKIIITDGASIESDDFLKKLNGLLKAEGKTLDDLQGLYSQPTRPLSSTESIAQTMSALLSQNRSVPLEGHSYRRLRMFSRVIPTPAGEESLEHWLEQAYVMVEECECSEKEKKRRIMESVKGPALEVIQSVRSGEPEASPKTYLDALNTAFGSAESAEDVYFSFRLLQQRSGERLSDFLRRLEKSLTKVVQMGGLPSRDRDRARVEQLLWGAVASDLLLVQLRLRERKNNPPSFLELLGEIRVEEEYLVLRRQVNTAVRPVQTVETTEADQSVVLSLRAELKDGPEPLC
uniref:Paraneoplastic antigen Ma1 homolog n=1 Tax=Pygocentrus nattereri TaxID=42514 RepID=A0A3B4DUJ8_PYGNA